jgi:hypothetical protein
MSHRGRVEKKIRVGYFNDPDLDSISTCLIYNIYLLLLLKSRVSRLLDLSIEWAES